MKTHEEAREFDTRLAALYTENAKLVDRIDSTMAQLHSMAHDRKTWVGRNSVWTMSHSEVLTACREVAHGSTYRALSVAQVLLSWHEMIERHHQLIEKIGEQERIYRQDPWSRYILCLSYDGHIHSMQGCSTLRPTSQLEWHPEFSGLTEDQAVNGFDGAKGLGPILCTVCFPSAPVEHKRSPAEWKREQSADVKAAERAQRDAVKNAKRLAPSEVFRTRYGTDRVETVALCKELIRRPINEAAQLAWYQAPIRQANWQGDAESLARVIRNTTDMLAQMQADAAQATTVLLAREAAHEGWGATQAEINKIVANATKKASKDWA